MKFLIGLILLLTLTSCALPRPRNVSLGERVLNPVVESYKPEVNILAISGGGPNGFWSAGFLYGWADKPNFDVVTGVSVGSLIANYAFLQDAIDVVALRDICLSVQPKDISSPRPYTMIIFNDSVQDSSPLKRFIAKHITNDYIDRIGQERSKGRYLFIGVTDLDRGEFRYYDMTDIAYLKQYDLYRQVILASCSVPVLFSPVFINGSMMGDGALTKDVFVPQFMTKNRKNIYVLFNGKLDSIPKMEVERSISGIGFRSIHMLISGSIQRSVSQLLHTPDSTIYLSEIHEQLDLLDFHFKPDDVKRMYYAAVFAGFYKDFTVFKQVEK